MRAATKKVKVSFYLKQVWPHIEYLLLREKKKVRKERIEKEDEYVLVSLFCGRRMGVVTPKIEIPVKGQFPFVIYIYTHAFFYLI
jgi:hypothetical protein